MKKTAALFVMFAVLISFFMIPCCASSLFDYPINNIDRMTNTCCYFFDSSDTDECDSSTVMLDTVLFKYYYELRITLKRSIIFANIAN